MGTYNTYSAQHQEFERHMTGQIATIEAQIASFQRQGMSCIGYPP